MNSESSKKVLESFSDKIWWYLIPTILMFSLMAIMLYIYMDAISVEKIKMDSIPIS